MPSEPSPTHPAPRRARLGAAALIALATLAVCWGIIATGSRSGRGASDDYNYHWVAIQQFARQLPSPDLSDYASATTPGYHLLLSPLVAQGLSHAGTQLVASIWTIGLLGVVAWVVSRRWGWAAAAITLPLLCSMYVVYAGAWLLPDNSGWLLVLLVILLALRSRPGWTTWIGAGLLLIVLVWLRQVHIWAAAPVWLAAWLGNAQQTPVPSRFFSDLTQRLGRTLVALACTIPAFMFLAWFVLTWGGLVPPTFQDMHQGPNPATPGFILTQLAILSIFYAPVLLPRLRTLWAHHWRWIVAAGVLGLVVGVLPASSYSYDDGRYGGWWNLIGKFPAMADRSPIFILGALAGSIALVCWLSFVSRRDIWVWAGVGVAFALAQTANHASWQRYHEPMLLIMILLIIARSNELLRIPSRVVLGSLALSVMLAAITVASLVAAGPLETSPPVPAGEESRKIEQFPQIADPAPVGGVSLRSPNPAASRAGYELSINAMAWRADGRTITGIL